MSEWRMSRRQFVLGAGALVAGATTVEGAILAPARFSLSRIEVGPRRDGVRPIRLVVLADLHLGRIGRVQRRVARAVADSEPDGVVLLGDVIDSEGSLAAASRFLDLLPSGVPRWAVLGNWEYWSGVGIDRIRSLYAARSVRLLVDESVQLRRDAALVGLDDFIGGAPRPIRAAAEAVGDTLWLAHCPAQRDAIPPGATPPAAILSGHTHGGQVTVAGWAPIRPPGSGRYVSGWYRGGGPPLYVSRGLGTSVVPLRLGSSPELVLVEWTPRADATNAAGVRHPDPIGRNA